MIYRCCDQLRRNLVAAHPTLNGIDYLEVIDRELPEGDPLRQRTLLVHLLKPVPVSFNADNVRLLGGERVTGIDVQWAASASPLPPELGEPGEAGTAALVSALADAAQVLVVRTSETGDFGTYTLTLALSVLDDEPPPAFDPRMAAVDFSFKVECPSEFDCQPRRDCPPRDAATPDINYLAKDYPSFRRLLLDRLSQLVPQWRQSSVADYGVAVAEVLAYAGDQLSYEQDAIATEAYLGTARQRISVRRHALLVDYPMHDGCNARAWLQLQVAAVSFELPLAGTRFLTRLPGFPSGIPTNSAQFDAALRLKPEIFEPLLEPRFVVQPDPTLPPNYLQPLYSAHNEMRFYTWSNERCCLPQGATSASLAGSFADLHVGDALLLVEVLGPDTGKAGDADPGHRHVVRLSREPRIVTDPLNNEPVTELEWAGADALPFPLCISGVTDEAHGSLSLDAISLVRGNLVLVDHGATVSGEALGSVPLPSLFAVPDCTADRCDPPLRVAIPPRYRPRLAGLPLTQAAGRLVGTESGALGTLAGPFASAAEVLDWSMAEVYPQMVLDSVLGTREARWTPRRSLLSSGADATDFVAEVDDDGGAQLRFGDDAHGERPDSGTVFTAAYRVGNGGAGNVGAGCIVHVVAQPGVLANIDSLDNPLSASGGIDMESIEDVRRNAPRAFRTQERAVTPADYAEVTERDARVQRAAAALRWTGSWYTVFITPDALAGTDQAQLEADLPAFIDRYRMAGHDLEFNEPRYVSLEIEMHVCVKPDHFRSHVKQGLLAVFKTLFHPDNFSFGQTVYLSPLYAAAHDVPGVDAVEITTFQRQGTDDTRHLLDGALPLAPLEIARLDNDRNFPEHGVLRLMLDGGK